jgi:hypothetical protein
MFSKLPLPSPSLAENRTIYEIVWENFVELDGLRKTKQKGACALRAGYLRLQTHMRNV